MLGIYLLTIVSEEGKIIERNERETISYISMGNEEVFSADLKLTAS